MPIVPQHAVLVALFAIMIVYPSGFAFASRAPATVPPAPPAASTSIGSPNILDALSVTSFADMAEFEAALQGRSSLRAFVGNSPAETALARTKIIVKLRSIPRPFDFCIFSSSFQKSFQTRFLISC
jgi:hypothetical protein